MEQKFVGRSGVYYHLGVINPGTEQGQFVSASVRIDVQVDPALESEMLAASALSNYSLQRTIIRGANVFDLAIQGYQPGNPASPEATKNFEYMLHMVILRGVEHIKRLQGDQRTEFANILTTLMRGLVMLEDDDLAGTPPDYLIIDRSLAFFINSRIVLPDGTIQKGRISMSGLELIQWLSNYSQRTSRAYIDRLKAAIAAV